ncbi:MAG: GAF domain-containing protein, partial [Candidatus Limnocylindria bacterium]
MLEVSGAASFIESGREAMVNEDIRVGWRGLDDVEAVRHEADGVHRKRWRILCAPMTRAPSRPELKTPARGPGEQHDSHAFLSRAVEEVARLLNADGAMVYMVDPAADRLRFEVDAGIRDPEARQLLRDLSLPVGVGLFGAAISSQQVVVSGDYRRDKRFQHSPVADRIVSIVNMRSMAAAPLVAEGEVFGALGAYSSRIDDFSEAEITLLRALADHAATAIANQRLIQRLAGSQQELARLTEDLKAHSDELAHRVEAQRTLAEMAAQLTSLRDPSAVLEQTLRAAVRLLKGHGGQIGMVNIDADGGLRWGQGHSLVHNELVAFTKEDQTRADDGVSGRAIHTGRASWTDDYLADRSFAHEAESDRLARELGIRAVIAAPLIDDDGPLGAIGVFAETPGAFDADAGELLGLLADQAAIVLANARLNAEADVTAETLAHRVEAQRTLGEIAASITSIRDPSAVLSRAISEAKRLLDAEHVLIHQVMAGTRELADYRDALVDRAQTLPVDDTTVAIGQGIAGRAVAESTVAWTGDYLGDSSFAHTSRADEWIGRYGYHSQMSAPLIGEGGPLGAISAYSTRRDAFDADDAELLGALASQAAIVLANARLYEELERRVEAQRSLGEIAARITAIRDPGDVLQRTLDEAVRLLDADGGRIELVAAGGGLHWAFGHSAIDLPIERDETVDPVILNEGVSGRAVLERRVVRTGDYLADPAFAHAEAPDRYIRQHGIRSVMSAPLIGEDGAIGSLTVHSQSRDAFDASNAELLEVLASQAAIAVTNARLYERLGAESVALARQTDSQRRLLQINQRLLSTLDPASVLELVADGLKNVVWYDNLGVYRVEAEDGVLRPVLARDRNADAVLGFPIPKGRG